MKNDKKDNDNDKKELSVGEKIGLGAAAVAAGALFGTGAFMVGEAISRDDAMDAALHENNKWDLGGF